MLYNFTGGSDGYFPTAGVVIGSGGVLYGTTTVVFGAIGCPGTPACGTVFSLTPPVSPGGAWTEAVLYNFNGGPSDGAHPYAGVVIGSGGVLYGTTDLGGPGPCFISGAQVGCGTVFSLAPPASPGGAWTETVLHTFAGGTTERALTRES